MGVGPTPRDLSRNRPRLVGAPGATPHGAVYVFERTADSWTAKQELHGSTDDPGFGSQLRISGDTLVVGFSATPKPNTWHTATSSQADVFVRSAGTWSPQQHFDSGGIFDVSGDALLIAHPDSQHCVSGVCCHAVCDGECSMDPCEVSPGAGGMDVGGAPGVGESGAPSTGNASSESGATSTGNLNTEGGTPSVDTTAGQPSTTRAPATKPMRARGGCGVPAGHSAGIGTTLSALLLLAAAARRRRRDNRSRWDGDKC